MSPLGSPLSRPWNPPQPPTVQPPTDKSPTDRQAELNLVLNMTNSERADARKRIRRRLQAYSAQVPEYNILGWIIIYLINI